MWAGHTPNSWQFPQCLTGFLHQTAWILYFFSLLKYLLLEPRSRADLDCWTRGLDLGRLPQCNVKAPEVCLQQCLLPFKHKCSFHIAKVVWKLFAEEKPEVLIFLTHLSHYLSQETNFAVGSYFYIHLWLRSPPTATEKNLPKLNFRHFNQQFLLFSVF